MSVLNDRQFISQTLGASGGATRSIHDHSVPPKGYAVGGMSGVGEHEVRPGNLSVKEVRDHQRHLRKKLSGDPTAHQGSWNSSDRGKVVLDASNVYANKGRARLEGLKRKQDAIYDIGSGKDIPLPRRAVK